MCLFIHMEHFEKVGIGLVFPVARTVLDIK